MKKLSIVLLLAGCSATTSLRYTMPSGAVLDLNSAKSQAEERANWKLIFDEKGNLNMIDLGTKNTVPVNLTADTLGTIIGMIPGGAK